MSRESVELVRAIFDLWNSADAWGDARTGKLDPRLIALTAPDATYDMSRRTFNPEIYEGHAGLVRLRRDIDEVWEAWSRTTEQIIDAGERVVVIETVRGRGRGSGVEVTQRGAFIYTVRDGQVIHVELYPDPQAALKAVGLEE